MKIIYGGAMVLGAINIMAVAQAVSYFAPLLKVQREKRNAIKSNYSWHMRSLKKEAQRLSKDTRGRSFYDKRESMERVVDGYSDYYEEAMNHRMPKRHLNILSKHFLGRYQNIAHKFEDGVHKFHPEMEI